MTKSTRQDGSFYDDLLAQAINSLERLATQQNSSDLQAVVVNMKEGHIVEAEPVFSSIAKAYEAVPAPDADLVAQAYVDLAAVCLHGEGNKAMEAFAKVIELQPDQARPHALLGHGSFLNKEYDQALVHVYKALDKDDRPANVKWKAVASEKLGIILHMRGDMEGAASAYEVAARGFEQSGDDLYAAECMGNLALIYRRDRKYDEAALLLKKSLTVWTQKGRDKEAIRTLGYLASVHFLGGKYEQALAAFGQRAQLNQAVGDSGELAADHANMGNAANKLGRSEAACASWREAVKIYTGLDRQKEVGVLNVLLQKHGCPQA